MRKAETTNVGPMSMNINKIEHLQDTNTSLWMQNPLSFPGLLENFRELKANILVLRNSQKLNVFLLTSSENGVGVSTMAFNLALVLAMDMFDQKILLVDTNLSNPTLSLEFKIAAAPGLMDYLLDQEQLDSIIQKSFLPNLFLAPLGKGSKQVLSPFDLKKFSEFIDQIRRDYDFVIMDSAPALQSSHSRIASSKVDGVILVAAANKTRFEVIAELKQQLERNGAQVVGAILNKRKYFIPKMLYRYI